MCSCFDEDEEKYETWIDYTIDGYWQTHEYYEGENFAWMPLPEPFGAETAKESNEEQYDKIMRVSAYLIEMYGDKIWEEFGIEKTGNDYKDMFSMLKIFDEIYRLEKEKYPLMWYEYCEYCIYGNGNME